ncbi:TolC family protein [Acidiphilium sp.]|uniref:TolC family protein n=1 Tax=Acidiphilium sp. TaxID=527 RepID=UPI003D08E618
MLTKFLSSMGCKSKPRWGLDALTLVAVFERPDLAIADAEYAVARGSVISADALPNPTMTINPEYNASNANPSPFKIGPVISFLVDSLGARQAGVAAAKDQRDAARQAIDTAAWLERSRVRTALLAFWNARHAVRLARRNAQLAQASERAIAQRYRAGIVSSATLDLAMTGMDQALYSAAEAARSLEVARGDLAAAVGVPAAAFDHVAISTSAFDAPRTPHDIAGITRAALVARPSVLAALATYRADQELLRQAIDAQYPGVSIGPGYHYSQGDNKYILALSLPLPIFNQNQGPIASARATRHLAAAQFKAAQLHVLDQIDTALVRYRASQTAARAARRIARQAKVEVRRDEAAYRIGGIGIVRLLGAKQQELIAQQNSLTTRLQTLTALGLLEDALHHRFFGRASGP